MGKTDVGIAFFHTDTHRPAVASCIPRACLSHRLIYGTETKSLVQKKMQPSYRLVLFFACATDLYNYSAETKSLVQKKCSRLTDWPYFLLVPQTYSAETKSLVKKKMQPSYRLVFFFLERE